MFSLFTKVLLSIGVFILSLQAVPFFKGLAYVAGEFSLSSLGLKEAVIGEARIILNIADTESLRKKGLSGRDGLDLNEGLLFVFDKSDYHGIRMKDMNFSIDIIWLNDHKEVIYYQKNVSPNTFPKVFAPEKAAKFVLEMPAGFIDQNRIKKGDLFSLL